MNACFGCNRSPIQTDSAASPASSSQSALKAMQIFAALFFISACSIGATVAITHVPTSSTIIYSVSGVIGSLSILSLIAALVQYCKAGKAATVRIESDGRTAVATTRKDTLEKIMKVAAFFLLVSAFSISSTLLINTYPRSPGFIYTFGSLAALGSLAGFVVKCVKYCQTPDTSRDHSSSR